MRFQKQFVSVSLFEQLKKKKKYIHPLGISKIDKQRER